MNLSMRWLNDFVDTSDINDIKDFCEKITMSGYKVEKYEIEGNLIKNIVVGKVLSIEKHPNADKLVICQVDVGDKDPIQIVTGAHNLKESDLVPVALDGSTLTNGAKIKKGKLRGVLSNGMMCSLKELGLTINDFPYAIEDGIFVLKEDCKLGQDIREVLGFNDTKIEFEITPNRPDCLSVIGLAREVAATFNKHLKLKNPIVKADNDAVFEDLKIENLEPNLCPFYSARLVKNVKVGPSPRFIRERLRAMGVRPINNIVDITNYVMLEYGQPMHAFDLKFVKGNNIKIRLAKSGEKITTLDGIQRTLSDKNLIIANSDEPMAIAGVMGGEYSGITDETTDIVLESANFYGPSVRLTAKEHNLRTDSSSRFEKGLDKFVCSRALDRACELIELLKIGDVDKKVYKSSELVKENHKIKIDYDFINKFLNLDLSCEQINNILIKIDCKIENDIAVIPTFRNELKNNYDLAEEVARFYGYDNIPITELRGSSFGHYTKEQLFTKKVKQNMLALGVSEAMTYTFISPKQYDKLFLDKKLALSKSLKIVNPLGEDTSIMRTNAVASMLDILSKNYNNKNSNVRLFEIAKEYIKLEDSELPLEREKLIAGFFGENIDFLEVKGILEELLKSLKIKSYDVKASSDMPYYHPGRCAKFLINNEPIGYLGEIHPKVLENYEIKTRVYVLDFSMDKLFENADFDLEFKAIPKFPAVNRDLAVVCDESVPVLDLKNIIVKNAGNILENVELFDVYKGKQVLENKKSVAFNLTFRSKDSTLSDEQVNASIKKIIKSFEQIGISLR